MKKTCHLLSTLLLLALIPTSCISRNSSKDENKDVIKFEVSDFNQILLRGGYQIELEQGNECRISASGDTDFLDKLSVTVHDNQLVVTHPLFENGKNEDWDDYTKRVKLKITVESLEELKIIGGAKLRTKDPIMSDHLLMIMEGGGSLNLDLVVEDLTMKIEGGLNIELNGHVKNLKAHIEGAGRIAAMDLKTEKANIKIEGAGYASLNVTDHLDVNLQGVGWVKYKGDPRVTKNIDGIGFVSKD